MPKNHVPSTEGRAFQGAPEDWQSLLMTAPIGIYVSTPEGRLVYANSALARIFGYDSPSEMIRVIKDTGAQLYADPEDREEMKRFLEQNERLDHECRFLRRDGTLFWASYNARAVRDQKGGMVYFQGFLLDITDRKQERESLKKARFAMDSARDSILWVDDQGDIVYANDSACTSMGYTREELLSLKVFDIDPDFPPDKYEQHKEQMKRQGSMFFESRHRTKDGRLFPVEVSTNYFRFNDRYLACAFDRDITERKRAEEAIEKRIMALTRPLDVAEDIVLEDLFNLSDLQHIQDLFAKAWGVGALITLPDGTPVTQPSNFTYFCGEFIRKTEKGSRKCQESDAMLGRHNPSGPIIHTCLSAGLWGAGASITVGGRHIANWLIGQVRNETQTRDRIIEYAREIGAEETAFCEAFDKVPVMSRKKFEQIAYSLFALANQLSTTAYQNIQQARFISDRKRAEAEREKLQEQLLQSQKLEAVGTLAGGVAHDFNNMLGAITGYAELTLAEMDPADPSRRNLERILDAAQRSANLTRQLLAFARKQTIEPIAIDLNESVEATLKMIRRLIGENIELAWLPGPGQCTVKMDSSQLDQILVNLCVNAKDAIADVGRVTIETDTVSFDPSQVTSYGDMEPGEYVLLALSDDGCGMDKETLKHIFEPFFTTKGLGQGTGMGLATVYGIVKQNQGFINVYSEPGQGTTFRIYLPLNAGDAGETRPETDEAIPQSRGETILIVEDDPGILEMSTMLLKRLGYAVLSANTPGEALGIATEESAEIHLIITDVVMPEMNGRELVERLQTARPEMKSLFMSGYTADVIAPQGVLDRGLNFIQKPFSLRDIAAKIRMVLD
ncbi:MAG: PocR ligand-binding domain-containing protein [Deltaproteobacteria bacterium]|nr:PocR ligand-binding domain-containing protein [Deltaproteobacteria bacterium]